jgi:hypothetical protein
VKVSLPSASLCRGTPLCTILLLTCLGASRAGAGAIVFDHASRHYRVVAPDLRASALHRLVRSPGGAPASDRLKAALDSLGYFWATWDTLGGDTVLVRTGRRSIIDTIIVHEDGAGAADSLRLPPLPCPYDAAIVSAAAQSLLRRYSRRGHPFATVSADTASDSGSPQHIAVVLDARPERFCRFGQVLIRGEVRTRRRQLLKDVAFRSGEPFDIDKLEATRRGLASRTYVRTVEVGSPLIEPRPDSASAGADSGWTVAVPLTLADRHGLALDGAVGFEASAAASQGLVGSLDFTLLNAMGSGEQASVVYRGEHNSQRLSMTLAKEWLGSMPITLSGGAGLEIVRDDFGFLEGKLQALYDIMPQWRAGVGLNAHESTRSPPDSASRTWQFYGAELVIERPGAPRSRGLATRSLSLRSGAGVADRDGRQFTRWSVDFAAGLHLPAGRLQAFSLRVVSDNLFTPEQELTAGEVYRVGGYRSVRGYADEQFALRNVAYGQLEYLLYFSAMGATYIFADGGLGSVAGFDHSGSYTGLLGYGVGLRVPVKIGSASIEWARSIDDTRGLGRLHVRITNALAGERW